MKKTITTIAVLYFIFFTVPLSARIMSFPGLDGAAKECELIVIATPLGSRDTGEFFFMPDIWPITRVFGVETSFRAIAVLKGNLSSPEFKLHHHRLPDPQDSKAVLMGPMLVSFPFKDEAFIMFLNKDSDDLYVASSGQIDPACSIRPMADYCWTYGQGYVFTYNRSYIFFMWLSAVLLLLLTVMMFYARTLLRKGKCQLMRGTAK